MLGTREATRLTLSAWHERNKNKPLLLIIGMLLSARQYREGFEKGYAQSLEKAKDWYIRRQTALEQGLPFDEPPPWENNHKTD